MKGLVGLVTKTATALSEVYRNVLKTSYAKNRILAGVRVHKEVTFEFWAIKGNQLGGKLTTVDMADYTRKRKITMLPGDSTLLLTPSESKADSRNPAFFYHVDLDAWCVIVDDNYKKLMSSSEVSKTKIQEMLEKKQFDYNQGKKDAIRKMESMAKELAEKIISSVKLKKLVGTYRSYSGIQFSSKGDWDGSPSIDVYLEENHFGDKLTDPVKVRSSMSSASSDNLQNVSTSLSEIGEDIAKILSIVDTYNKERTKLYSSKEYKEAEELAFR